jgi:hypothetical protein
MPLLTLFTAPKPFTDPHIDTIQRNALRSWLQLPDVEVQVVGEEPGLAEAADELGLEHLPAVARNQWGTPLVSSIFDLARRHSESPLLCYANADILLLPDLVEAARRVREQAQAFLVIGRRWDLDVRSPLDFGDGWQKRLRERTRSQGRMHPPAGSDYFIFPHSLYREIPAFAIGRAGWDNWMIYHARKQGWAVVDATPDVMVVHQNHDYAHLGGVPHYDHEESQVNIRLARGPRGDYTGYLVLDTNRELRGGKVVRPRLSAPRLVRRLELALMPPKKEGPRWAATRRLRRLRRKLTL